MSKNGKAKEKLTSRDSHSSDAEDGNVTVGGSDTRPEPLPASAVTNADLLSRVTALESKFTRCQEDVAKTREDIGNISRQLEILIQGQRNNTNGPNNNNTVQDLSLSDDDEVPKATVTTIPKRPFNSSPNRGNTTADQRGLNSTLNTTVSAQNSRVLTQKDVPHGIGTFDPESVELDAATWIKRIRKFAPRLNWSDDNKVQIMTLTSTPDVQDFILDLPPHFNFEQISARVITEYPAKYAVHRLLNLETIVMQDGEDLKSYISRFKDASRDFPDMEEAVKVVRFIKGLARRYSSKLVSPEQYASLKQAIAAAKLIDLNSMLVNGRSDNRATKPMLYTKANDAPTNDQRVLNNSNVARSDPKNGSTAKTSSERVSKPSNAPKGGGKNARQAYVNNIRSMLIEDESDADDNSSDSENLM